MRLPLWRRLLPVAGLLPGLALFLALRLQRHFSLETLARNPAELTAWVRAHGPLAALTFVVSYAVAVAFSLPIAMLATPVAGFLFGVWFGAALSVVAATLGSI